MLIFWNTILLPCQQQELLALDPRAVYWPASWAATGLYSAAVPLDWWISFSLVNPGLIWIMRHGLHSRVVYE